MCPTEKETGRTTVRSNKKSSSSRIFLLLSTIAVLAICVIVSSLDTESKREQARLFLRSCHSLILHISGLLFPNESKEAYSSRIRRAFFSRSSHGHVPPGHAPKDTPITSNGDNGDGTAKTSLSHPAQNLLVDVTGDDTRRSRMGRACLPAEEQAEVFGSSKIDGNSGSANDEEYVELIEALASGSIGEAAVEIRPSGAVMSRTAQSLSPWTMRVDKARIQNGDPVVGMTIQVFPLDWVDDEAKYLYHQSESLTSPYALGRVSGVVDGSNELQRSLACVSPNYVGTSSESVIEYQLEKQIKSRLGLVDTHTHDYMYKPVLSLPGGGDGTDRGGAPGDGSTRKWEGSSDNEGQAPPYHERYEWMDDHAFAGGSHGEVWHARRRCHSRGRSRRPNGEFHPCDDQRKLIMKRLKVEHGYDLLEAGLREVHFGELLAQEKGAEGLFTQYIDHFFREVPAALRGSSRKRHVELWIVFEDAGPSLRS